LTDAVVISGATAVAVGAAAAAPLLSVPELVDVAIADPGTGMELVIRNRTSAPLRVAVEDIGDVTIPRAGSTVVPLPAEPGGARLHLQALASVRSHVITVIVTIEPSDDGPIAVGQAIGAPTC
jgi:hypothetical protein